jgi:hypothetical protein
MEMYTQIFNDGRIFKVIWGRGLSNLVRVFRVNGNKKEWQKLLVEFILHAQGLFAS